MADLYKGPADSLCGLNQIGMLYHGVHFGKLGIHDDILLDCRNLLANAAVYGLSLIHI